MHLLGQVWRRWKAIAQVIGDFQARILLTLFYFILLTPGGIVVRAVSDPLRLKPPRGSTMWTPHLSEPPSVDGARRQY